MPFNGDAAAHRSCRRRGGPRTRPVQVYRAGRRQRHRRNRPAAVPFVHCL